MRPKPYFKFGNIDSRNYGLIITDVDNQRVARRRIRSIPVPGRSGNVHIDDDAFENIQQRYKVAITDGFAENYQRFVNDAVGRAAERLQDNICPDVFLEATLTGPVEPVTAPYLTHGGFWITFECAPKRYLREGERPIVLAGSTTLQNEWQPTKPLIKIECTGFVAASISGTMLQINGTGRFIIDCETQHAYDIQDGIIIDKDSLISLSDGWPVLKHGGNAVAGSGSIQKFEITPRWWRL